MASVDKTCVRIAYKNNHYLVPVEFILRVHPGGQKLILPYVNQDITRAFLAAKHPESAIELLEQWMEGGVAASSSAHARTDRAGSEATRASLALRWRTQFAAWAGTEATQPPYSALWNAFVFGVAGATATAAVFCRH